MIYLDNGATSFRKPETVELAMLRAMRCCANPGRGAYPAAMAAANVLYRGREVAAELFECKEEQVVFTNNCTHGLNIAIHSLVKSGSRVVISGFEHNAVTRPLHRIGAQVVVAGRRLYDWTDTLEAFEAALKSGVDAAVFTHVSNAFGYILPVEQMAALCRKYNVPFVLDAAQSAGSIPVSLKQLGASFIAMPGHKGLLGPQGTGILLCAIPGEPLLTGGTGSQSRDQTMPEDLPDRLEPGTANVPGIAGLTAGMEFLQKSGINSIFMREHAALEQCVSDLRGMGLQVFSGPHQGATVSFVPPMDCETFGEKLAHRGIAVRSGLHCAPLAHESAGTLNTGTVRISFGHDAAPWQNRILKRNVLQILESI